jgi:hypothetical protein
MSSAAPVTTAWSTSGSGLRLVIERWIRVSRSSRVCRSGQGSEQPDFVGGRTLADFSELAFVSECSLLPPGQAQHPTHSPQQVALVEGEAG